MNIACTDRCVEISVDCITGCDPDDITCYSQCQREIAECINSKLLCAPMFHKYKALEFESCFLTCNSGCPCELNCLDGCEDCDNPVCNCEVSSSCSVAQICRLGWFQMPVQVQSNVLISPFRWSRTIRTGIVVSMITVSSWEDVSMHVKTTKSVKTIV